MDFANVYEDTQRAEAYAKLEFPGTYYLAYRDLPEIIRQHIVGTRAIDFGCGTGRSARFLKTIGFDTVGVDISKEMLEQARERDPNGQYSLISEGNLQQFKANSCDLVLSVFTFDNIPTLSKKVQCFTEMGRVLNNEGKIINLVSSPLIYTHEWASFTTSAFPENQRARSGDKVKIIMKDVDDRRPVEDVLWTDEAYQEVYKQAGLQVEKTYEPLGKTNEPHEWMSETTIAPWMIYVLRRFRTD